MQKINLVICIGNGNEQADLLAQAVSRQNSLQYHGFLDNATNILSGCYHTSIYDIKLQQLKTKLSESQYSDIKIVVLDQNINAYPNEADFYTTIEMAQGLSELAEVAFVNQEMHNPFSAIVESNSSFCIMPFISMYKRGNDVRHCCFMSATVTTEHKDFQQDEQMQQIRKHMISGTKVPTHCGHCYSLEENIKVSPRKTYTVDWAHRLNIKSLDQVQTVTKIVDYDIRLGNKCNALCRSCGPKGSNLIAKEYFNIGIVNKLVETEKATNFDIVDISTLQRLYAAGGEPTINVEFLDFLQKCIDERRTDIQIVVNTNAAVITDSFIELVQQFNNLSFEVSIDGYADTNYYIRWPIIWKKFKTNVQRLSQVTQGKVSFNTVVSIYNIGRLSKIYKFLESHYPASTYHMHYLSAPAVLNPWNFNNKQLVLDDLDEIMKLAHYNHDVGFKSYVDGIANNIVSTAVNVEQLAEFFKFNDKLDQSRNIKLKDYIPELEACRV